MKEILKQARLQFPKGTVFYSATGVLKAPMTVYSLQISMIYPNCIVNSEGGVIFDNGNWAKKWED